MINILSNLTKLNNVEDTSNQGTEFLISDGVLYIKGSDDLKDWITNFSTIRQDIHAGFMVESTIIFMQVRKKEINLIVGHSAGGAIACLVGLALDVPVITFGSPRFYHQKKAVNLHEYCVLNTTHYQLKNDPVCLLPFWYSKKGGSHILLNGNKFFGHFLSDYIACFRS